MYHIFFMYFKILHSAFRRQFLKSFEPSETSHFHLERLSPLFTSDHQTNVASVCTVWPSLFSFWQCFPKGADLHEVLEFYFQVRATACILQIVRPYRTTSHILL